jgi:hypothetical protein
MERGNFVTVCRCAAHIFPELDYVMAIHVDSCREKITRANLSGQYSPEAIYIKLPGVSDAGNSKSKGMNLVPFHDYIYPTV